MKWKEHHSFGLLFILSSIALTGVIMFSFIFYTAYFSEAKAVEVYVNRYDEGFSEFLVATPLLLLSGFLVPGFAGYGCFKRFSEHRTEVEKESLKKRFRRVGQHIRFRDDGEYLRVEAVKPHWRCKK